jgi:hypothetical protein
MEFARKLGDRAKQFNKLFDFREPRQNSSIPEDTGFNCL